MPDLAESIRDNQTAVVEFIAVAGQLPPDRWNRSPASRKWTPAQLVDHVRLVYDLSLKVADGSYVGLAFPGWVRVLFRRMFFARVLARGYFKTGGRGPKAFDPASDPGAGDQLFRRLQAASDGLEQCLTSIQRSGRAEIIHPFFGALPLADYLRFQAIHTRHHLKQLEGG